MMKSVALGILAAVMLVMTAPAYAGEADAKIGTDDPSRIAAARELMDVMGVTAQMEAAMSTMKQAFLKGAEDAPADKKAEFAAGFDDGVKRLMAYRDDMLTDFAKLYASNFTAEEMQSVTTFYRSGAGAKFVQLMPKLMEEGAAIGMKYSARMIDELKKGEAAD